MLSSQNSQLAIGGSDRLRFAAGFFFLLTLTVAAFASGRLHFGFDVPIPLRDTTPIAFVLSGLVQTWAMLVNPFSSPVVGLQTERGHPVLLMPLTNSCGTLAIPPCSWVSRPGRLHWDHGLP
jgi:hypothetical protein